MELSDRARKFLKSVERNEAIILKNELELIFRASEVPLFEPLVYFQSQYGGYVFDWGSEPIHIGLKLSGGGYPIEIDLASVEYEESEDEFSQYNFPISFCESQVCFTLDENGKFYINYSLQNDSFDKYVEEVALYKELELEGGFKKLECESQYENVNLANVFGFAKMEELSDSINSWFKGNNIYYCLSYNKHHIFLMHDNYERKKEIEQFIINTEEE